MYDFNDMTSIISLITSYVFLFFGQSVIFLCPFIGFLQTLHFGGCLSLTFFFIVNWGTIELKRAITNWISKVFPNILNQITQYLVWLEGHFAQPSCSWLPSFSVLPLSTAFPPSRSLVVGFCPSILLLHWQVLLCWHLKTFEICLPHNLNKLGTAKYTVCTPWHATVKI